MQKRVTDARLDQTTIQSANQAEKISYKQIGNLKIFTDKELGRGATAIVYRGELLENTEKGKLWVPVAVKTIKKGQNLSNKTMNQEFNVINKLKHRHIVEFKEIIQTTNNYYYVFELVEGSDLKKEIDGRAKPFSEFEAQKLFRQFSEALIHLSLNDVVHRDLKPANIMLSRKGEVKLTDFGLARVFKKEDQAMMETQSGTPYFQSPERLRGEPFDEKADMWSAGIILFQMLTKRVPFPATSAVELHEKVMRGFYSIPDEIDVSDVCLNLVRNLIQAKPENRMGIRELREHIFVKLEPAEYQKCILQRRAEQLAAAQEKKAATTFEDELTKEDLREAILGTEAAIGLTYERMKQIDLLLHGFKVEIPNEASLKLVLLKICREA